MANTTFNAKAYVKNATRSIAYVATQTIKETNPYISDFAETNSDVFKEMYSAVRDYKKHMRLGKQAIADSEYMKIAKETVTNILDDLKTGNFYNKERSDHLEKGALGLDIGDDWDMNLDDIDIDFGDDDDSLTFSGMDDIGEKIVKGTGQTTLRAADYIVKSNRATSKGILAQNELLFGKLNNSLYGINSTIASLGKSIMEPMSTHFQNSTTFYENNTKMMAEQTGYLKQIYEMMNTRFNPPKREAAKMKNKYSDVFGYGGVPDLREYAKVVKGNFEESMSLFTSILGMLNMDGNGGMLRSMLSSPVASLMKGGTTALVNKAVGKDLEKFNKSLSGFFGSAMLKLNRYASKNDEYSGIGGFIANLLNIKPNKKNSIDTSKYEKGRVDWNGKDEKALRDVIPIQLAQILSALTGQEAKIFNYETGKWVKYSDVGKDLRKEVKNISRRNTRDIQDEFEKYFLEDYKSKGVRRNSKAFHTFQQDMQNFYHYLTLNTEKIPLSSDDWTLLEKKMKALGFFNTDTNSEFSMLHNNFIRIKSYYTRNLRRGKGYLNTSANGAMFNGRNEISDFYNRQENDASSMYSMVFSKTGIDKSGKGNNFLTNALDDKGNNLFFYLQNFYSSLERIADNTEGSIGRSSRSKKVSSNNKTYTVPTNNKKQITSKSNADRFTDVEANNAFDSYGKVKVEKKEKAEELKDRFTEGLRKNRLFKKMGKTGDFLAGLIEGPSNIVRNVLDSVDDLMYQAIYGKQEGKENPGILAKIMQGFDDTFSTIKTEAKNLFRDHISPLIAAVGDKISNLFGFKTFKDMKDHAMNGLKNSVFFQNVGNELKSAGKWARDAVFDSAGEIGDYFTGGRFRTGVKNLMGKVKSFGKRSTTTEQAADGGHVTKSGMVAVSEGEMIIPSEKNPFYKGSIGKAYERAHERSIGNKYKSLMGNSEYWGEYSNGSKSMDDSNKRKNKSLIRKAKKFARRTRKTARKVRNKVDDTADAAAAEAQEIYEDTMDDIRETEGYKKTKSILDNLGEELKNGFTRTMARLFGKTTDSHGNPLSDEEIQKNMTSATKDAWNEIKKHAPRVAAGGIIGAGASLVTGMIGGPLLGAAVGSAIGLATTSEKFQEKLFGKTNENGDYEGGVFGPRFSNFVKKQGKIYAKFGVLGTGAGMLGLVPGGPIAGLLAGSAMAYATQSDDLRNYLFGTEGLLGKDSDKKIKKAFPKMAIGAGAMMLTGPFGLMGNAILGAGAGLITESDKFKEAVFGVKDSNGNLKGGLLGIARKQIIDPIANYVKGGGKKFEDYMVKWFFEPLKNVLKPLNTLMGHGLNKVGDLFKRTIKETIGMPFMRLISAVTAPITRQIGGFFKGIFNVGKGILTLPGRGLNKLSKGLNRRAVSKGYATNLSAEERAQMGETDWYLSKQNYATKDYDKRAAEMSAENLEEHQRNMNEYRDRQRQDTKEKKKLRRGLFNEILADTDYGDTLKNDKALLGKFNNSINTGNLDEVTDHVNQLIASGKIDKNKGQKLLNNIGNADKRIKDINSEDLSDMRKKAESSAKALGVTTEEWNSNNQLRRTVDSDLSKKLKKGATVTGEKKDEGQAKVDTATASDVLLHPILEIKDIAKNSKDFFGSKLDSILVILSSLAEMDLPEGVSGNKSTPEDAKKQFDNLKRELNKGQKQSAATKESSSDNEDDDSNTKIDIQEDGNPATYRKDKKGNWYADIRDASTKKALAARSLAAKQKEKITSSLGSLSGVLGGLKGIFGEKEDEEGKKKGGLLSKLLEFIGGGKNGLINSLKDLFLKKTGPIGQMISMFMGNGAGGGILKTAMSTVAKIIPGTVASALGALGIGTLLDNIMPKDYKKIDEDGNPLSRNGVLKMKDGFDATENMITGHKPGTYEDGEYERKNMSTRILQQGLGVNGLIRGHGGNKLISKVPVVGKMWNASMNAIQKNRDKALDAFGGTKLGKSITNSKVVKSLGSKAGKLTVKAGETAGKMSGTFAKILEKDKTGILKKMYSLIKFMVSKALKLFKTTAGDKVADEVAEKLTKSASEAGMSKVTKSFAKSAAMPIQIAFIGTAVIEGWQDARAILGILDKPTLPERFLAAIINGANEAVPGIGGVIPTDTIFDILFGILSTIGIVNKTKLKQKREEAKKVVADYNNENGKTYSVREYIKNVLGDYTLGERIGNTVKKGAKSVWGFLTGKNKKQEDAPTEEDVVAAGSGLRVITGGASGAHVSQKDPKYSSSRFGSRTIGEIGCGPAAAASVLKRYGRDVSLRDTAAYAKVGDYVAGDSGMGTKSSYFGDILGSNGINSSYTDRNSDIQKAVGSGKPTILLGQDRSNKSKTSSPFGPNPHYVVAQGTDRKGNVIVDDPELGGTALYKKNILKNAKLGVVTGGDSELLGNNLLDNDYIGKYVQKYESGNKGSDMISSGSGDNGGVSFGTFQFPSYKQAVTTSGTLPAFWNQYYASQYPNVKPGDNAAFKDAWKDAVAKNPIKFAANEHSFIGGQYYKPISSALASNGVGDPTGYDRAAQEAAWSSAVHYGPSKAANIFKNAGVTNSMSPDQYITKLYDYKKANVGSNFRSSSQSVQNGIIRRFDEEKQMLLGLAGKKPIDPGIMGTPEKYTNDPTAISKASSSSESGSDDSTDIGGVLDKIIKGSLGKVFGAMGSTGSALSKLFGLSNDSDSGRINTNNNGTSGTSQSTSTAVSGSGTDVNFTNTKNTTQENSIVSAMRNMFGWMAYSQSNRGNFAPGGSSDCSATVQHVLKSTIGVDPGGDTGAQITKNVGRVVDIGNGSGPNESKLRPGDLLFYKRDWSRKAKKVSHVEMYMGQGWRAGHGGGTNSPFGLDGAGHGKGPFPTPLSTDASRFIEAKRYTTDNSALIGAGSGLKLLDFTQMNRKPTVSSTHDITRAATKQVVRNIDSTMKRYGGDSGIGSTEATTLLQTAVKYMETIAQNTSYNANIKAIVEILTSMMQLMGATSGIQGTQNATSNAADTATQETQAIMAKLKKLAEAV